MKTLWLVALACALSNAGHATAAPRPAAPLAAPRFAPVVPTTASRALGAELATLLNSDAVTRVQFDKLFTKTMPDAMRASPVYQELERQYPGIIVHIVVASRPIVEAQTRRQMPLLIGRMSDLYAGIMTEAELRAALGFYSSPTGNWLITSIANGSDASAMLTRHMDDPDATVESKDVTQMTVGAAMGNLIASMTPERMKAMRTFMASPAGRKIAALGPEINAASAEWANRMKESGQSDVAEKMLLAAQGYIAAHPKAGKAGDGS